MTIFFIILGLIAIIGGGYIWYYNGLVKAQQKVREAWSGIDVQLKRRYDLIPNLVETVKGYAKHESKTLENVTLARSNAIATPDGQVAKQAQSENILSGALKSIFALSESYPDLKADQNFLHLQEEVAETEDQIAASRRIYNGNVTNMNVKVQSFPSKIIAGIHHFSESEFFELDETEKKEVQKAIKIKF